MKNHIFSFILLTSFAFSGHSSAALKSSKTAKSSTQKIAKDTNSDRSKMPGTNLNTDHHFNDLTVRGKYQSASEGLVTVENEKIVEDILDYRTHYKDRLQKSLEEK